MEETDNVTETEVTTDVEIADDALTVVTSGVEENVATVTFEETVRLNSKVVTCPLLSVTSSISLCVPISSNRGEPIRVCVSGLN